MNLQIFLILCITCVCSLAHHRGDGHNRLEKRKDRLLRHITHDRHHTRTSYEDRSHNSNGSGESDESNGPDHYDASIERNGGKNDHSLTSSFPDYQNNKVDSIKHQSIDGLSTNSKNGEMSNRIIEVVTLHPIQPAYENNDEWNHYEYENPIGIHQEDNTVLAQEKPMHRPTDSWNRDSNQNSHPREIYQVWSGQIESNRSENINGIDQLSELNNQLSNDQSGDRNKIAYDTTKDKGNEDPANKLAYAWNGDDEFVDPNIGSQDQPNVGNEIIDPSRELSENEINDRNWNTADFDTQTHMQIKPENRPVEYINDNLNNFEQPTDQNIPSQNTGMKYQKDDDNRESKNINGAFAGEQNQGVEWSNTIKYNGKPSRSKPVISSDKVDSETDEKTEEPLSSPHVSTERAFADVTGNWQNPTKIASESENINNIQLETAPSLSRTSPSNAKDVTYDDNLHAAATKTTRWLTDDFTRSFTESSENVNNDANQVWSGIDNDEVGQATPKFSVASTTWPPASESYGKVMPEMTTANAEIHLPGPSLATGADSPSSSTIRAPPLTQAPSSNINGPSTTPQVTLDDAIHLPAEDHWQSGAMTEYANVKLDSTSSTSAATTPSYATQTSRSPNSLTTSTEWSEHINNEAKVPNQIWPEDYWSNTDDINTEETLSTIKQSLPSDNVNVDGSSSQKWPSTATTSKNIDNLSFQSALPSSDTSSATSRQVTHGGYLRTEQTAKIPWFPPSVTSKATEPSPPSSPSRYSRFSETTRPGTRWRSSSADIITSRTTWPRPLNPSTTPTISSSVITAEILELGAVTLSSSEQSSRQPPPNHLTGQSSTVDKVPPLIVGPVSNVNGPSTTQQPTSQSVNIQVQPVIPNNSSLNHPAAQSIPVIIKRVIVIQPVAVPVVPIGLPCGTAQSPCQNAVPQVSDNQTQVAAIPLLQSPCSEQRGILLSVLAPCPLLQPSQ